ncbi:MAG: hypothetical protein BGO90_09715 [Legionella sp. 40-6]|nr:DUF493 domain-containing protein [Legionella sp.]OJY11942.1 MAG: hypothetical protein BGO90_09715 [Legionella sp. 40-6]
MTDSLIEFPCNFPIKIIGYNSTTFLQNITDITLRHFPNFEQDNISQKPSQGDNYLAITVTVYALNKEMLDNFYRELTQHPEVKMVL